MRRVFPDLSPSEPEDQAAAKEAGEVFRSVWEGPASAAQEEVFLPSGPRNVPQEPERGVPRAAVSAERVLRRGRPVALGNFREDPTATPETKLVESPRIARRRQPKESRPGPAVPKKLAAVLPPVAEGAAAAGRLAVHMTSRSSWDPAGAAVCDHTGSRASGPEPVRTALLQDPEEGAVASGDALSFDVPPPGSFRD